MEKNVESLRINSYAKINLFLDVLGKREDGYHEIRTVFSEIGLYDTLNFTLTKKEEVRILTNKDFVKADENLIYKIAIFLKKRYNVDFGVTVELGKNIPIAAGLGGGSSNAAATIDALSTLWNLNLSDPEKHEVASQFGSDINFFLEGGCAIGEGRGELIKPLEDMEINHVFLVNPGFGIPSSEAYKAVIPSNVNNSNWQKLLQTQDINFCFNKLEEGIRQLYPEIDQIINYLEKNGASKAILSGSGATIIAFCSDQETTEKFCSFYSGKGYWNFSTKTKGRTK